MCIDYDKVKEVMDTTSELIEAGSSPWTDNDDDGVPESYSSSDSPPDDPPEPYPEIIDETGTEWENETTYRYDADSDTFTKE